MTQNLRLKIVLLVAFATALGLGWYAFYYMSSRSAASGNGAAASDIIADTEPYIYSETYTDSTYRFSFQYPSGFAVTTIAGVGGEAGKTVLVQSTDGNIGIQMLISPYGDDADITEVMIRNDIPDLELSDVQPVEVGPSRKGLAFVSNNPAFSGKSRDVWFVFNGDLYQISTYAEHDALLKGLFGTWQFHQ